MRSIVTNEEKGDQVVQNVREDLGGGFEVDVARDQREGKNEQGIGSTGGRNASSGGRKEH